MNDLLIYRMAFLVLFPFFMFVFFFLLALSILSLGWFHTLPFVVMSTQFFIFFSFLLFFPFTSREKPAKKILQMKQLMCCHVYTEVQLFQKFWNLTLQIIKAPLFHLDLYKKIKRVSCIVKD